MYEYVNYYETTSDEDLLHYGVPGMKWGIRRARRTLTSSKSTQEKRDKALNSLEKHRVKASEKVAKLESKRPKLEDSVNTKVSKYQGKAAELADKAARQERKAYGIFATQESKDKRLFKAGKLQAKADTINADIAKAKARLAENDAKTNLFKRGIKDIDKLLIENGRKVVDDVMNHVNTKTYNSAKSEYDNNRELVRKYVSASKESGITSPTKNPYYKSLEASNTKLTKDVEKYLDSVGTKRAKELIKKDPEHDEYGVKVQVFDPDSPLDDYIYISKEYGKRIMR